MGRWMRAGIVWVLGAIVSMAGTGWADTIASSPFVLKTNGGWCWYQDERAIVVDGNVLFGSVAGAEGRGAMRGDVEVTSFSLERMEGETFTLHARLQSDDHDVPVLLLRPDGRLLAVFSKHSNDNMMRWRISEEPGRIDSWTDEQRQSGEARVTYSNLHQLSGEGGRIYNFHRGFRYNPNYFVSDDGGETFNYGGRLFNRTRPGPASKQGRPYVKYASNGVDTIHFAHTEDHPRDFDNSIYHGFIRGGLLHGSDGRVVGELSGSSETEVGPTDFTQVFKGDPDNVAWIIDLELDDAGNPFLAFSVQKNDSAVKGDRMAGGSDLRYYYARWDGKQWLTHEMAHAGSRLYAPEVDYTGLVALDPYDPDTVYISTDAEPSTGAPLISSKDDTRHYEIFQGKTVDGGKNWEWKPVTADSESDNIRPVIPAWDSSQRVVLWLRGRFTTYSDYDLDIVGILEQR